MAQQSSIPIVVNRRWNIFVNLSLLDKAGIRMPPHIVHKAIKVEQSLGKTISWFSRRIVGLTLMAELSSSSARFYFL